jgi:lipid-A-disaccharide synthase
MGGPHLRDLDNFVSLFRVEDLSVMGVGEVLARLPGILKLLGRIKEALRETRPAALIAVDAPSFNFRVIKAARELDIPVYYYIGPKIWAWKEKRACFLQANVRRLISILPFEEAFYRRFGMRIDYVGNPLMDMIDWPRIDALSPEPGRVGFLPGSRGKEITALMPEFGKAARIMKARRPELAFACAAAPGLDRDWLRSLWPSDLALDILPPDDRYAFMRRCDMLIAASGTATLEAALIGTPTLVTYKVSPLTWMAGKCLLKVPYISLSNLILDQALFPELLQRQSDGKNVAARALAWLEPDAAGGRALDHVREALAPLRGMMRKAGATAGAAALAGGIILDDLRTVSAARHGTDGGRGVFSGDFQPSRFI